MEVVRSRFEDALTPEQFSEIAGPMVELVRSNGWPVFVELLKGERIKAMQQAFAEPPERMEYWRGYVQALLDVMGLPIEGIRIAKDYERRPEPRSANRVRRAPVEDGGDLSV